MSLLFSPVQFGRLKLNNRILMAPMTRSRAELDGCANALMAEYYQQRATAGLIISEGVYPSEDGKGYCRSPGIADAKQQQSWAEVNAKLQQAGGQMVMQLMHCGRIASRFNKAPNSRTVAPSSIQAKGEIYTDAAQMQAFETPEALSLNEIAQVIAEYQAAAQRAIAAGCVGVELHCTSGYLPAQFLSSGTNQRQDQYGGNVENRIRFVVETLSALSSAIGADRVGLRICPGNSFNDLHDEQPEQTFRALLAALKPLNLAYLHLIRATPGIDSIALANEFFAGKIILNDGFDAQEAEQILQQGLAQAISFGRAFIANPDFPARLQRDEALAEFDHKTLYTPGAEGYTNY